MAVMCPSCSRFSALARVRRPPASVLLLGRLEARARDWIRIEADLAALPLQIHPNKELAAELHEQDPENYPE